MSIIVDREAALLAQFGISTEKFQHVNVLDSIVNFFGFEV